MSPILKLCGVLAVFAIAVLANPLTTNEGTMSKNEDKIARINIDVPLNDDPEAGGNDVTTETEPSASLTVDEPTTGETTPDAPSSEVVESGEHTTEVPVSDDASSSKSPNEPMLGTSTEKAQSGTRVKSTTPAASSGAGKEPRGSTTTAAKNGSGFTSPNIKNIVMLIIAMYGH